MSLVKYRLKEVAADFGVAPKEIAEIVAKFSEKPKSNTQVLTDEELNCVFDYMTQKNPISDLSVVFAAAAPKAAPAPKQEAPKADAKPQQQGQRPQQQNRPQQGQPQKAAEPQKSVKPAEPERKRERRVVDTSAVQVNANRFADVDNLVSERVQNYQGGKQKFGKKGQQQNKKDNKFKGNKARNEEQEKLRKLQMEVARKAPTVVKIPDEITVGELASRMKKTAAEVIKCLMKNGVMAGINQAIDFDTAEFVATELGCKVEKEITVTIEERIIDDHVDTAEELETRAPVVVGMGPAGLFAALTLLISPHLVVVGAIIALVLGYKFSFEKHDHAFDGENLERTVRNAAENVKTSVNDFTKSFQGSSAEKAADKAEPADEGRSYYSASRPEPTYHPSYPTMNVPVQVESQDGNVTIEADKDGYSSATVE